MHNRASIMVSQISKKRKVTSSDSQPIKRWIPFFVHLTCILVPNWIQFVADGVFFAEINEVLTRELAEDGYSGVEVRVTPMRTQIIIRASRTQNVLA